jgi:hypothetical protein
MWVVVVASTDRPKFVFTVNETPPKLQSPPELVIKVFTSSSLITRLGKINYDARKGFKKEYIS